MTDPLNPVMPSRILPPTFLRQKKFVKHTLKKIQQIKTNCNKLKKGKNQKNVKKLTLIPAPCPSALRGAADGFGPIRAFPIRARVSDRRLIFFAVAI